MKKVKMIRGNFGLHTNGITELKNSKSEPFYVDDETADYLVSLGEAEIIEERVATPKIDEEAIAASENKEEKEDRAEDAGNAIADRLRNIVLNDEEIPYKERPNYDENTKVSELREIGKKVGISFPVGTSKEKMIELLDAFFDEYFDEPLELVAEEPSK